MKDLRDSYTSFHDFHKPEHVYPTEWVIRTFLGKYPKLSFNRAYKNAKILDIGFGDGRNWPLLHNAGFDPIYGIEITDDIVSLGEKRANSLALSVILKVGKNSSIPFERNFFDYILACHSCYYVDAGTTFSDNLYEFCRVLKPGGNFIASLPEPKGDIFKGAIERDDGHVEICNDPWGLRNGYIFKCFKSEENIIKTFSPLFHNFSIGLCCDNYYGIQINYWLLVCTKMVV